MEGEDTPKKKINEKKWGFRRECVRLMLQKKKITGGGEKNNHSVGKDKKKKGP